MSLLCVSIASPWPALPRSSWPHRISASFLFTGWIYRDGKLNLSREPQKAVSFRCLPFGVSTQLTCNICWRHLHPGLPHLHSHPRGLLFERLCRYDTSLPGSPDHLFQPGSSPLTPLTSLLHKAVAWQEAVVRSPSSVMPRPPELFHQQAAGQALLHTEALKDIYLASEP